MKKGLVKALDRRSNDDGIPSAEDKIMGNSFLYPFINKDDDSDENLWFDDTKPIKLDEHLWIDDAILIQFGNDDILEHMGAYSKLPNSNEKDEEENEISRLNGSLVLLQKDDKVVEVEVIFLILEIKRYEKISIESHNSFARYYIDMPSLDPSYVMHYLK